MSNKVPHMSDGLWPNSDSVSKRDMQTKQRYRNDAMNEQNKLEGHLKQLEESIKELEAAKLEQEKKAASASECEKMFELWTGLKIEQSTETTCNVKFSVISMERKSEKYTLGFHKFGPYWKVAFFTLPYSMTNISMRVEQAKIDSIDKLSSMIRDLQLEVVLFVRRRDQFQEALTLSSPTISIYPGKSTTSVMLEFRVNDNVGSSDLTEVCVHLSYRPEKFLPDEPIYEFTGGDDAAQEEFRNQLRCLEHMPLKEAIVNAFGLNSPEESSMALDVQMSELEVQKPEENATLDNSSFNQKSFENQPVVNGKTQRYHNKPGPKKKRAKTGRVK